MQVFSWLDSRTLVACDLMLATAFAVVLFAFKRAHPNLRGINTIAISFLLLVPGTSLIVARGTIPSLLSVTLANGCILGSFVLLYRGILRFIGSRRSAFVPIAFSCVSLAVVFYYSHMQNRIVPGIVALSLTVCLIRGMIALELFRKSPTFPAPHAMRIFAAFMSLFAAIALNRGMVTLFKGATSDVSQVKSPGNLNLVVTVVSVFVTGLFILLLSSSKLIAASRDESQKDSLSGALNRRGIEVKLATELKRIQNGKSKLSIALIDIDFFKSINDVQGHAAGDDALREVAEIISTRMRGRDSLGRYGGDEFLLILPQTSCNLAAGVTERLSNAVGRLAASSRGSPLTLSIGLTEATLDDDAVTLIARADKALYQAKSDGRNCRRVVTVSDEATQLDDLLMPNVESSPFTVG